MTRRRTGSPPLTRRVATRPERRIVRIFTEGEGSEPDYIRGFVREFVNSDTADVRVEDRHGTPRTLVNWARESIRDEDVDDVWCVFDVESPQPHPFLHESRQAADAACVRLAISNPCFEYWLLLHFRGHTKAETSHDMESLSRRADGRAKKRIDFAKYTAGVEAACRRAQHQERCHHGAGTAFPDDNPSTSMPALIEFLRAL